MKKSKKTVMTALLFTSAVSLASCDWFTDNIQNVYGPPVDISSEPQTTGYDPYYDMIQPEYGVPDDYEISAEEPVTTENYESDSE